MKLAFSIAKRFLGYSKGQTVLIAIGIAIGVSVQIFIGLLITGLQEGLIDKTVGSSPHITITHPAQESFLQSSSGLEMMDDFTAVGYQLDVPVFIIKDESIDSLLLRGISEGTDDIYGFSSKLISGRMPNEKNEVILGDSLADKLELSLNDTLTVVTIDRQTVDVTVVGTFDLKVAALNNSWMISTLQASQSLVDSENKITSIEIQIKDVFTSDVLVEEIEQTLGSGLTTTHWKLANEELLSGLNGQSISSIMIQIFVLVSVVLGIASVLAITVLQKSRQIGILKAMGIQDRSASFIFLFQGLILGVWGAVLGILFGLGLIFAFTTFARNPDGSALIAIRYDIPFIVFSGSVAIISALFASMIPAIKSKKLSPIEVIRNG